MWCETKETQPLSTGTIKGVRKVCLNETLYMIEEQFRWQPPTQTVTPSHSNQPSIEVTGRQDRDH